VIPDSQCGFRLVRLAAWNRALPGGGGFLIESDMLVRFREEGFRVEHAPVQVLARCNGHSRIRVARDTVRWWRWRRAVLKRGGRISRGAASAG
jgi:hypothetical protein